MWKRWLIILCFAVFEISIIGLNLTGAFYDEGIYGVAGIRTLQGFGISDNYLNWFSGSLLWPVISGSAFLFGGLTGIRLAALFFAIITLIFTSEAVKNIYGENSSFWATLLLAVNGPFLALSHFGVYDLPALAGVAGSFWALTKLITENNRKWVFISGVAFALAVVSKYPIFIMLPTLLLVLIKIRRSIWKQDVGIFIATFICALLFILLPFREQVGVWLPWFLKNPTIFATTKFGVLIELLYYSLVPLSLLPLLIYFTNKKRVPFRNIFLLSLILWPLYHLSTGNPVSMKKHIVFGFIFFYPLIGVYFYNLWEKRKALTTTLLAIYYAVGIIQLASIDTGWVNETKPVSHASKEMSKNQELLINNPWPYTLELYSKGLINSPWKVYDYFRVIGEIDNIDFCKFDWFIDETQEPQWPKEVKDKVMECGTYKKAYEHRSKISNFGPDGKFVTYEVTTSIWKNSK